MAQPKKAKAKATGKVNGKPKASDKAAPAPEPECVCLPIPSGPGEWWWDGFNAQFLPKPEGVGRWYRVWDSETGPGWLADNADRNAGGDGAEPPALKPAHDPNPELP